MIALIKTLMIISVFLFVSIITLSLLAHFRERLTKLIAAATFFIKSIGKSDPLKAKTMAALGTLVNADEKRIKLSIAAGIFLSTLLLGRIVFSLIASIGVFISLTAYFNWRTKRHIDLFENQLQQALRIITNSVNTGLSLLQAIENVVKETRPPLSSELSESLMKVRLGAPLTQALSDAAKKVNSKDFTLVVTVITIAKETGGNLGEVLLRVSETIRERRRIQGKIKAMTAQGRASGTVMALIPFVLLAILYFLEPGIIGLLFSSFLGNIMLLLAFIMVSLGLIIINRIVAIDI